MKTKLMPEVKAQAQCDCCKKNVKNTMPKFPIFYDDYCETSFAEVDGETICQECLEKRQHMQSLPEEEHDICDICGEDLSDYADDMYYYEIGGQKICEVCLLDFRKCVRG